MRTWFDDDSRPVAVDETHPADILEPDDESPLRSAPDALRMIESIGSSYLRGDPFIIQVAWSFLLNRQSRSMDACAKELGCTRQAISRQVTRLAREFGYPLRNKVRRQVQREAANRSWAQRKRRGNRNPPAATDNQSKTNAPATPDTKPSIHPGGVNDSSDFNLQTPT